MFTIKNPTFGTDFEMPLMDKNGKFVSAVGRIGGTKLEPLAIGNGCFKQEDNVNAEMGIPPVSNVRDWEKHILYCIDKVNTQIEKQELVLYPASSMLYTDEELDTPEAQLFGCEPSFDAYNDGFVNPRPESDNPNLRSAGFHIHVGCELTDEFDLSTVCEFMQYMDGYVGMPSLVVDRDTRRRQLYGKAGEFRFRVLEDKNIVIMEYRTLGSGILESKENIKWIFEATQAAIAAFNTQEFLPTKFIRDTINNHKFENVKPACTGYRIAIPHEQKQVCAC